MLALSIFAQFEPMSEAEGVEMGEYVSWSMEKEVVVGLEIRCTVDASTRWSNYDPLDRVAERSLEMKHFAAAM